MGYANEVAVAVLNSEVTTQEAEERLEIKIDVNQKNLPCFSKECGQLKGHLTVGFYFQRKYTLITKCLSCGKINL